MISRSRQLPARRASAEILEGRRLFASTVGDFVWRDDNANGIQDAGEPGIDGVTVELYKMAGNTLVASTITAGGGQYLFTGVEDGVAHYLRVVPPANHRLSPVVAAGPDAVDNDFDRNNDNRSRPFAPAAGDALSGMDAGLVPPVQIAGFVWDDVDADGIQDPGEPGRDGVTVALANADGTTLIGPTTTTANGGHFVLVAPYDTYRVRVTAPVGMMFTRQNVGTDDTVNSDANPAGVTDPVSPLPGQTDATLGAGIIPPTSVRGTVFRDVYGDGAFDGSSGAPDPGIDTPNPGWTVFIDDDADGELDPGETTAVTTSGGAYEIPVFPGTYTVGAVPVAGWEITTPAAARTATVAVGERSVLNVGADPVATTRHPAPLGGKFRVNGEATSRPAEAALASNASGATVAVWMKHIVSAEIVARRLDAAGNLVGPEITVTPSGSEPQVAVEPDGRFVVVWSSTLAIRARRFNADGTPLGAEFEVSGTNFGTKRVPRVAAGSGGGFGVSWEESFDVYARRYNAVGNTVSGPTKVNQGTAAYENGGVAMDAAGRLTVAYSSGDQVLARVIGGAAASFTVGTGAFPDAGVGINPAGDRLFVWQDASTVYGRLFAPNNTPRGERFRVSTSSASLLGEPKVVGGADGFFMVVWEGPTLGAVGQLVGPDGVPHGREFRLSAARFPQQGKAPAVAAGPDGTFLASWESSSSRGIEAQRFETYTGPSEVGDFVWSDLDKDGIQDPQEPGIAGIELELLSDAGSIVDTVRSGPDGAYRFRALKPGMGHQLHVVPTDLFTLGSPADQGGDDMVDNDVDPVTGLSQVFAAPAATGEFNPTIDVGLLDAPPRVAGVYMSGTAWTSAFKNQIQSSFMGSATLGYRISPNEQTDELPWTNVNQVTILFNEPVNVAADDLVVRGVNNAVYAVAPGGFTLDPTGRIATWTLATDGIPNDKLLLDLDADAGTGVTDAIGQPLDGEWTNPVAPSNFGQGFPSGDGVPGGDFRFRLNVLPGDVNRSGGSVVGSDVTLVRNAQNATPGASGSLYTIFKDVNGSGTIVGSDVTAVRNRQGLSLPAGEPVVPQPEVRRMPAVVTVPVMKRQPLTTASSAALALLTADVLRR